MSGETCAFEVCERDATGALRVTLGNGLGNVRLPVCDQDKRRILGGAATEPEAPAARRKRR